MDALSSLVAEGCGADGVTQSLNPLLAAVDAALQSPLTWGVVAGGSVPRGERGPAAGAAAGTTGGRYVFAPRASVAPAAVDARQRAAFAEAWAAAAAAEPPRAAVARPWALPAAYPYAPFAGVPWPAAALGARGITAIAPTRADSDARASRQSDRTVDGRSRPSTATAPVARASTTGRAAASRDAERVAAAAGDDDDDGEAVADAGGVPTATEIRRRIAVLDTLWRGVLGDGEQPGADADVEAAFDAAMARLREAPNEAAEAAAAAAVGGPGGLLDQLAAPWPPRQLLQRVDAAAARGAAWGGVGAADDFGDDEWTWGADAGDAIHAGADALAGVAPLAVRYRDDGALRAAATAGNPFYRAATATTTAGGAAATPTSDAAAAATRDAVAFADELVRRGAELLADGDAASAVLAFQAAVATVPEHADAWRCLGEAHAEQDDGAAAVAALARAVDADPYHTGALVALGAAHVNDGNEAAAIGALGAWMDHHPAYAAATAVGSAAPRPAAAAADDPYADGSAADALMRRLLTALGRDGAASASASADVDVDAEVVLGVLFNITGDATAAAAAFRRALRAVEARGDVAGGGSAALAHGAHTLLNRVGASLANGGDHAGALAAYGDALRVKPRFARGWVNAGISHGAAGAHGAAAAAYLRALRLAPAAGHVWALLRGALAAAGREDLVAAAEARDPDALAAAVDALAGSDSGGYASR